MKIKKAKRTSSVIEQVKAKDAAIKRDMHAACVDRHKYTLTKFYKKMTLFNSIIKEGGVKKKVSMISSFPSGYVTQIQLTKKGTKDNLTLNHRGFRWRTKEYEYDTMSHQYFYNQLITFFEL